MVDFFREFVATLPEAARALYQFGDPAGLGRGWMGAAVTLLWFGPLMAVPLFLAKVTYGRREWFSATMGVMGAFAGLWWLFGVLPHAWIQFAESNENILSGAIIPTSVGIEVSEDYRLDIASNFYGVVSDSIVAVLMVAGIVLALWMFLRVQRSYPKTLAGGETRPEAGGYK